MAAIITSQITERNYELIRDRIGTILTEELAAQTVASSVGVWCERKLAFQPEELPAINVSCDSSNFDSKHSGYKSSDIKYSIDVHTDEASTDSGTGDIIGSKLAQRIAGIIDYILEFPAFDNLLFTPGFIGTTIIESITTGSINQGDANHNTVVRLQFKVEASETTEQMQPTTAEGYTTQVKLSTTDFGHKYILNN